MHIIIGGGSGFIGTAITERLRQRGDTVTWISRTPGAGRITWKDIDNCNIPLCDVVINLAGQHILDVRRRWNDQYRQEVIQSRVETTNSLVQAINKMEKPPLIFVSTAGKCYYGTAEMTAGSNYPELDESSAPMGIDFPAELVARWEHAANAIDTTRIRHISVRLGVVLGAIERTSYVGKFWRVGRAHGFLPIIRLPFCLGLGAVMGHGRQPVPWIHIDDVVSIFEHLINAADAKGRFNAVSPGIVSNKEFTLALAAKLKRPVVWSAPKWLITALVGGDRASILLEGQNVKPKRTLEAGFTFKFPSLDSALANLVRVTF
jgi:uncharacterized protein